jgi:hypothetical protein
MVERIVWEPGWREQLGDLAEPMLDRADRVVLNAMEREIPRSTDGSYGRAPGYAARRLKVLEKGRDIGGRYHHVGTDATTPDGTSYPAILEHGSKPHIIESKGNYPLRDKHGRVFGRRVRHPGTKPIPWARVSAMALNGRVFR